MYARSMSAFGVSRSCLDHESTRKLFLSLYPNRRNSIVRKFGAKNWISKSRFHVLGHEDVLEAVSGTSDCFRGLRWGEYSKFAVLDIDTNSQYHSVHELQELKKYLHDVGLRELRLYRSSISDGWHLYIPFSERVPSSEIETLMKQFMKARNYKIISGQLEIFPSNNGLRLPLQEGFAWLADDGTIAVKREDLSAEHALRKFVLDIELVANDWEYTKSRINQVLEEHRRIKQKEAEIERQLRLSTEGMDELFQGRVIKENYERGREFFLHGLKSNGERHDAVICVEHYLWHGDESLGLRPLPGRFNDYDRYEAILSWLQKKHNGCCNHVNRGDWKTVESQIKRAVNWRSEEVPERTPYLITSDRALDRIIRLTKSTGRTWTPEDWQKANDRRKKRARRKIEEAVEELVASGEKVSIRKVSRVSGCHRDTVKKHSDLLPSGLGDLEPGGVGGCSLPESSKTPALVDPSSSSGFDLFSSSSNVVVVDFENLGRDPGLGLCENISSESVGIGSRKYAEDIDAPGLLDSVVLDAPVSLPSGLKKSGSESFRMVVFENGQLAIDFGFGFGRARRVLSSRRGREPPG